MQAMIIRHFGPSCVFEQAEIPTPQAGPGEVLIEVRASSVNPVDWKIRKGLVPALCPTFPAVLHPDCAGVVVGLGEGTEGFALHDRVYAFASGLAGKQGALAEVMQADARMVAPMPKSLDFEQAAALPLVAVTSWLSLIERTQIDQGAPLLIQGGTGGVGSIALQLARAMVTPHVYAACGTAEKCAQAEALGAVRAFNYRQDSVAEIKTATPGGRGFDVVFNTAGADAANDAAALAAFGGTILDINGTFPTEGPFQVNALGFLSVFGGYPITHGFDQGRVGYILRQVSDLVDQGHIRPLIDPSRFPFSQVSTAHDHVEAGKAVGKVVLTPDWSHP